MKKKEKVKKKKTYMNKQWRNTTEPLVFNDRIEIFPFAEGDIDDYTKQFVPDYMKEGFETYKLVDSYAEQLAYVIKNRLNGLIVGPTGCGKSSGVRYAGSLLEYPMRTYECNAQSSISSLIGTRTVKRDKSGSSYVEWINGIALDCWEKGMGLILEEVDSAPPGILFALHSLLQVKSRFFEVPEKTNDLIPRHPNFFVIATANTIGKGEDSFLYTGTNILNEAFLDRFSITYKLDYLSVPDEQKVLEQELKGLHPRLAACYVKVADLIRSNPEMKTVTVSTRRLIEWASMTQQLDWRKPVEFSEYTVLNRMTTENKEVAKKVIQDVFGSDNKRMDEADLDTKVDDKKFEKLFGTGKTTKEEEMELI